MLDLKRSRELQGFLDSIKKDLERVLGDLSMILCDPYAINFLAVSAMKILTVRIGHSVIKRNINITTRFNVLLFLRVY